MTEKRFEYYEHKGADYILDTPNKSLDFIEMLGDCLEAEEIVDLLNEQHDALIKKDELLAKVLKVNDNYEEYLKQINEVLSKYNIHTLEKLDQVLTNERTW